MAGSQHANVSGVNMKARVFRLRNLPGNVSSPAAVELLCQSSYGITVQDVRISSLASEVGAGSSSRTKVATITFHREIPALVSELKAAQCTIAVREPEKPLILDHHFQGVTPLNDVPDTEHKYDCLVISGLASHPFGSWQTHGQDKSFMWIRDELPEKLPGIRFLLYGYDTALYGSTSFQNIPNLAASLVQTMKTIAGDASSARPFLFLAHSLGGVVLKQALVHLAGGDDRGRAMLANVKGAILFGVPSQGMDMRDIIEMLGDQPNCDLVTQLSNASDFLPRLDAQFGGISYLQRIQFLWAFETRVTPGVEKDATSGELVRTGPGTVMVSRESATRNLCHSQPLSTIQIDKNHSDMVKFGIKDHYTEILASNLDSICNLSESKASISWESGGKTHPPQRSKLLPEWMDPEFWDDDEILSSLHAPERDRRLEQISHRLGNTFNWVYDDTSAGLSEWLQKGTGIFWINGKPASGKSTLMKFLYQDPRTHELLRSGGWKSRARLTTASFFFHHRGNSTQKSFEGLLRSLVSQILEQESSLLTLLYPILVDQYRSFINSSGLGNLEEDILAFVNRFETLSSSQIFSEVEKIVTSQKQLTESRQLGTHLERMLRDFDFELDLQSEEIYDEDGLDDIESILRPRKKSSEESVPGETSQGLDPTNWRVLVKNILQRQYRRQRMKKDIQARNWSRGELEECLRRFCGQSLFEMDLFLCLDALDEYDGRPEFIASFLQDLIQQPAELSEQPSTRIRILFSSRPWKALNDEFAACPGFQIHDYTSKDIIDFCAASIPSDDTARDVLSPLVSEIVRRARGVFLWVELVMRDLAQTVLQRVQQRDVEGLEQKLRKALDIIPDELDAYYQIIVQRIPAGMRWESYVVLETLCRSEEDVQTATLLAILKCSNSKSLVEAKEKLKKGSQSSLQGPGLEWGERYIKVVSGGLVEVNGLSARGNVQFMHQTVKQFVLDPRFKFQLLGNNIGMYVTENGHSFISKYLFVKSHFKNRFFNHAREAETTMGFSQYDFFSTASQYHYASFHRAFPHNPPSILAMAVFAGLQLCVSDAYEADRCCIERNSASLVSLLLNMDRVAFDRDSFVFCGDSFRLDANTEQNKEEIWDRMTNMAEVLVEKGLSIDENDDSFVEVARRVSRGGQQVTVPEWFPAYASLAVILMGAIPCRTESLAAGSSLSVPTKSTNILNSKSFVTELLHSTTPSLVQAMLSRGFDPNSLVDRGATPIDSVLARESLSSRNPRETLLHQYDMVTQLVHHGGLLASTKRSRWIEWETMCAVSGLDVTVFRDAGFPLWHSRTQPATKQSPVRYSLSRLLPLTAEYVRSTWESF